MKKDNKIIGIDWLQYRGAFKYKKEADERMFQVNDFIFTKKPGRTKDFESLYNVQYIEENTGELIDFACICADWNFREKLKKDLQVCKIYNHIFYLYSINWIVKQLHKFFITAGIMRIDFFCDFKKFENVKCEDFIKKVATNELLIKGGRQTQIVSKNGKYESATFGTRNSPVRCYLYNKSKELQTSGKEYIYNIHELNGLHKIKSPVWRLEFSILQPNTVCVNEMPEFDDNLLYFANLDFATMEIDYLYSLYFSLVKRYFIFRTNISRRKNKDFTPELSMPQIEPMQIRQRKYDSRCVKRTDKIVLKVLSQLNDELHYYRMQEMTPEQIDYFISSRQLQRYNRENAIFVKCRASAPNNK